LKILRAFCAFHISNLKLCFIYFLYYLRTLYSSLFLLLELPHYFNLFVSFRFRFYSSTQFRLQLYRPKWHLGCLLHNRGLSHCITYRGELNFCNLNLSFYPAPGISPCLLVVTCFSLFFSLSRRWCVCTGRRRQSVTGKALFKFFPVEVEKFIY
jgi:hypothetical protein